MFYSNVPETANQFVATMSVSEKLFLDYTIKTQHKHEHTVKEF